MTRRAHRLVLLALILAAAAADARGSEALLHRAAASQRQAEEAFARADAAIWFPDTGELRWLAEDRRATLAPMEADDAALAGFDAAIAREFPRFETNAYGPYLLKRPARLAAGRSAATAAETGPVTPSAAVFTDSFENGMGAWTLENNTLDLYSWGPTPCEARTGSRSADAVRGGVNTLSCSDPYAPSVTTTMTHAACEGIAGASQAWLDLFINMNTEINEDIVGFYYRDAGGEGWGYGFSGTFSGWFHLVFNLKQWYRLGDLTALSCPKLVVQFRSDDSIQPGYGARIDDLTIGNATPSFLAAAISASPSSGPAPLTVNFSAVVTGASSAATYQWLFGDESGSSSTTPAASFTYAAAGDYYPRLRVEDGTTRAYARTLVRVTAGTPCAVSCSANAPGTAVSGTAALFQASAAATGCSGTTSYSWSFGDGQSSSQQNASHAYAAPGSYAWSMTATNGGTSCTRSGTITVRAPASSVRRRFVLRTGSPTLAAATIGPAGGTLAGGGLTLTVPPGAFSGSAALALKKSSDPRLEGDLSDTFAITGLPAAISAGLALDIDVGSVSLGASEKLYIAADAGMYLKSLEASEANVAMLVPVEATLAGSKARVTLPATWPMPKASSAPPAVGASSVRAAVYTGEFRVKAEKLSTYPSAHFSARAWSSQAAAANAILTMLEEHYQRLVALGFSFACRESGGSFRKIDVEVLPLGTALGYHVSPSTGSDPCATNWIFTSDYLQINSSVPASDPRVRAAAAHELFHLVQDMYSASAQANLWLKEASSTWLENVVGICPDVQIANLEFAWRGLFNASGSVSGTEPRHGYGASFAIKYRTDQSAVQNDPFLATLWQNIKGGSGEIAAFQAALGSSLPAYWKEFARAYLSGAAPGSCFPAWSNYDREAVAETKALPKTISIEAYPLSARGWNLDLIKFKADEEVPVTVQADGLIDNQTVFVYDMKGKRDLGELTKASPKLDIEDLNDLAGSVLMLIFVDANLPSGSSSSTNTVKLSVGSLVYRCWAEYKVNTYAEGSAVCVANCRPYSGPPSDYFVGSVQADKFSSTTMWCADPPYWCRWRDDNASYDNLMQFDFTSKGATIENFRLVQSLTTRYGGPWTETLEFTEAVPRVGATATDFEYKLTSPTICGSVRHTGKNLSNVVCDGASYFKVYCEVLRPGMLP